MDAIVSLLNALAAIPKIADLVEKFAQGVSLWLMQRQTAATLSEISDAAAFAARAQTQEDRQASLDHWRAALSRPRSLP